MNKSLTQGAMCHRALEFSAEAQAGKPDGYVAGWATSTSLNSYGQVVAADAFTASIVRRGLVGPIGVKLLLDHRDGQVAGHIVRLEQRGERLWIEAQLNLEITYARDRWLAAKSAGGLNFSVGFRVEEWSYDEETDIITILRGDLIEVSIVTFPANEDAQMLIVL